MADADGPRRPVSVLVVVYGDDGQVLLLRRRRPFDFWQSVTGSLQADETHAAAARRELSEETGLAQEGELTYTGVSRRFEIDPRWRYRFPPDTVENLEYEWRFRLPAIRDIRLDETEHSEYVWVPVDQAIEQVWSWTNREALESLKEAM